MGIILNLAVTAGALGIAIWIIDGLQFTGTWWQYVIVVVILGLANFIVKPILRLLSLPIILFTLSAVHNTKPILIKTGRVMKLTRWQMVRWILFPAAIPEIFTGLRVGFALTLIGSLLAEMFASQRGLGYLLMNAIGLHNVELIMSVTLVIVVFAAAVSVILLHIDHRLHRRG